MRNALYTTTQPIAKEGWNRLVLTGMLLLLSYVLSWLTWLFFLLFAWALFSYRNPERLADEDDVRALISPIDGRVTSIAKTTLENNQEMLRIVIRKSFFDVGLIRAPLAMNVVTTTHRFGLFMPPSHALSSVLGERSIVICQAQNDQLYMVCSIGAWGNPIVFYRKNGSFKATERMGFLKDGEIAVLVSLDARIKVVLNDTVKAGQSVLGYLAYKD
jgi:phosphatidylserine decarboxylase